MRRRAAGWGAPWAAREILKVRSGRSETARGQCEQMRRERESRAAPGPRASGRAWAPSTN